MKLNMTNWCLVTWLVLFSGVWGSAKSINYKDALSKGIFFFQAQRSGKLAANQGAAWRADSALSDGALDNV